MAPSRRSLSRARIPAPAVPRSAKHEDRCRCRSTTDADVIFFLRWSISITRPHRSRCGRVPRITGAKDLLQRRVPVTAPGPIPAATCRRRRNDRKARIVDPGPGADQTGDRSTETACGERRQTPARLSGAPPGQPREPGRSTSPRPKASPAAAQTGTSHLVPPSIRCTSLQRAARWGGTGQRINTKVGRA